MEVHTDAVLEHTIQKINKAIEAGTPVYQLRKPQESGIPLPHLFDLPGVTRFTGSYSRWGYGVAFEAPWGAFKADYETEYHPTLYKGTLPEGSPVAQKIALVEARIQPGWLEIQLEEGQTLSLDVDVFDQPQEILKKANLRLAGELNPLIITRVTWDPEELRMIQVANEHVMVFASDVVYDLAEMQLVAAILAGENTGRGMTGVKIKKDQGISAILANLADNGAKKGTIHVRCPGKTSVWLNPARRGYTVVNGDMRASGARALTAVMEHPLTGDPSASGASYFYVLTISGEDLAAKFIKRLDLATCWAFKPEWGPALLEEGRKRSLVKDLTRLGSTYTNGIWVSKAKESWQSLLEEAIASRVITW